MAMSHRPAILKLLVVLFSRTLLLYFKLRSPTSTFGKNILIAGFPLFRFRKTASVSIGDDVVFINLTQGNYAGLTKPCSVYVGESASLRIGSNTWFSGVSIYCSTTIEIGSHVMCGANTWIWDTDFHPLEWSSRRVHDLSRIAVKPIFIGDDVFIGGNSIILKGVTIGARSVIGAGSVVVKNIPEDEIWAGNPARFIKRVPRRE